MARYLTRVCVLCFCLLGFLPRGVTAGDGVLAGESATTPRWLHDIRLGILAHDVDNLWSGRRKEEGTDFNAELVLNTVLARALAGKIRPNVGVSVNDRGDTSKLYGGVLWEWAAQPFFFNIGLGAAWHNGELDTGNPDKKSLGSRVLFRIPLEAGVSLFGPHRLSVMFDHVSNGYLTTPNQGLDTLGLRYSYVFSSE